MLIKILLSGDGGQGIQLIADMLAQAAFRKGLYVSQLPNYGLEQRGGVSLSFVQISDQEIHYPKFTEPDILLIMSPQARVRTAVYKHQGVDILDIQDYLAKLKESGIKEQSYNIFFLGILSSKLASKGLLSDDAVLSALQEKLGAKANWQENEKAFLVPA